MSDDVRAPLDSGGIRSLGAFWSLLLFLLGLAGIRDALVAIDVLDGSGWLAGAARRIDGLGSGPYLAVVAIVSAVLGLILLALALKPRRRSALSLSSESPVFVTPRVLGSMALASANDVDGVLSSSAKTSKSQVQVTVQSTSTDAELESRIRTAIEQRFSAIESKPRVKVRLRQERGGDL